MKLSKQERRKDITIIVSPETPYVFGDHGKPNTLSPIENIECLSRYLPYNKIPNLTAFRLMRIPTFIFSLVFFTCMGWGSVDNKASVMDVINSIQINHHILSIDKSYVPTLSWGFALGVFLACMYNISLYRRVLRGMISRYRYEYSVHLTNAIDSCLLDESSKEVAIYVKKNRIPSTLFLVVENNQITPYLMNVGALTIETDLLKAFVEYKPLDDGTTFMFPISNEYGKDISYLKLERNGNTITVREDGVKLPQEIIYDQNTQTLSVRASVEQKDMLS